MSLFDSASLVVTPNGYKEDKLYSIKPTDGSGDLVVTRATTATRVNSDGLVELVPYNLSTYSIDLNTWTDVSGAGVGITKTLNAAISPNGINNAISLIPTTNTGSKMLYNNFSVIASGGTFTMSCYAKANGYSKFALRESQSVGYYASFNLSNGTVIDNGGNTASIQSVGNGWYRCVCTVTDSIDVNLGLIVLNDSYTSGTPFPFSYAGNGTSGILIYGPQINSGTSAKEYFPTTDRLDVPRLDYTNSSCPSILVEPQRTNLVTYSEQFDNGAWYKDNVSISANSVTSPSGIQNADSILETATTTTHTTYNRASMTSGQAYTQSCYFKANGRNRVIMQIFDNATQYANAIFDLSSGVVVASFGTATIQNMSNGWYRCTITGTSPATGLGYCVIGLCENTYSTPSIMPTYLGNITKGVYAWGFQIEVGSYATSYIPTIASSVTRNADVISKTGISSLIGQTEGTIYAEFKALGSYDSNNMILALSDGTASNRIFLNLTSNVGHLEAVITSSGSSTVAYEGSTPAIGYHRVALAYKNNDVVVYIDGALVHTDTSATIPATSKLNVGSYVDGTIQFNSGIKSAALWKTRISNAELASLTTL